MHQYGMTKMIDTSCEQYKLMNIKDRIKTCTESQALDLLATNGRLVKRPIAVDGDTITVRGKVVHMEPVEKGNLVSVDLVCENQNQHTTAVGQGTAIVP